MTRSPLGQSSDEQPTPLPKADVVAVSRVWVEIVDNLDDLAALESEWDALLLRQTRPVPMSSYAWLASYFEYRMRPGQRWVCLVARLAGQLVGILPLVAFTRKKWKWTLPILLTPYDSHTYSVDMVIAPECAELVVPAFLKTLSQVSPGWFKLRMIRLAADSPALAFIPNGLGLVGAIHELCDAESVLNAEGSFDAYLAGLSRSFRRTLRRSRRKLDELADVSFSVQPEDRLNEALKRLVEVEALSWRADLGSDLGSHPSLMKSHQAMIERMQGQGRILFYFLNFGDTTVAAEMAFRLGSNLIIKKVTFREDYADYSPGNMLFEWVLRRAFEDPSIRLVNCLTDMPWHAFWKMHTRDNYHLTIYNRRPLPLLTGFLPLRVKQAAHHIPGLARLYCWWRGRRE